MTIICVDDERILMEDTVSMCLELSGITDAKGFTRAKQALEWLEKNSADIALLDIDMPEMNGLELAARIKETSPNTAIIFLTGYEQYALDAFSVHAAGYLLKPVSKEALEKDISYVLSSNTTVTKGKVRVETFGAFDVYVNGNQIKFNMAKCKELLAYLVDRKGGSVTRAELASILWEDRIYDRKLQKQLDVYIRTLRKTLEEYDISDILEMKRGTLRVVPEEFECDVYDFLAGDSKAVNSYRGEYMSAYSWASITEGALFSLKNNL